MEIERIIVPGGSLLREDRDEYITADWRNAAYRTTLLEVYLRACRVVYCALGRKIGQCVGRVDIVNTRPQEYNRWMNPEQSHSHQSLQCLRPIEIRMAKVDTFLQIIHIVIHQVWRRFRWIEGTHVLVISLRLSAGTLIETAAWWIWSYQCRWNSKSYTHMFQHGVPRETWQCIIMRGIETVTHD